MEFKEKLAVLKSSENRMNGVRTSWEKALANIKAQEDDSKEGLLHLNIKTQKQHNSKPTVSTLLDLLFVMDSCQVRGTWRCAPRVLGRLWPS